MTNTFYNYAVVFLLGMAADCYAMSDKSPKPQPVEAAAPATKPSLFTNEEHQMIEQAAKRSGKTQAQWVHDELVTQAR